MAVPLQTCSAAVKPAYIHAGVLFDPQVNVEKISRLFPVLSGFPCDCDKSALLEVLGTCNITFCGLT